MNAEALFHCLSSIVTQLTGAVFLVLLADGWRFPTRQTRILLVGVAGLTAVCQALFFVFLDLNTANLFATLADVAALLLAPILIRWCHGRLFFSMALTYSFTFTTVFFSHMVFPPIGPAHLAARVALSLLTALFLWRWFAPCLRSAYRIDISGWTALALIPLLYSLIFFILTAGKFAALYSIPAKYFPGIPDVTIHYILLVLPTCTYFVLYYLFRALLNCYAGFRRYAELSAQISAMDAQAQYESRLEQEHERLLSALDDDLGRIGTLIHSGCLAPALALSEAAEGRIASLMQRSARSRYTDIPILDTVLSDYAVTAEREGVSLSIQLTLPQRYDFELAALAVVLSNALENAMAACRAQALGRPRTVRLTTSVVSEQFFLLVENTCDTPVAFDAEGYPVTCRTGHGYGTRSIAAFARQQGGAFQYRWCDGWFTLQLLL